LIQKVNRPALQLIVSSPKATENDPGSSQGGGVAYEQLPHSGDQGAQDPKDAGGDSSAAAQGDSSESHPAPVSEQIGFGEVVREFKENHKAPPVHPGLTTHYQNEGGNAKGLLLNKKVE
jgi:hypothetical protein